MTVTLALPDQIAGELFDAAAADIETARVLLARQIDTPGGNVRLLARALHWVPDDAYRRREATALCIASHGYVPALAVVGCGGTGSAVIEQLVRLGARHLQLFDPDTLTAGNVTRVYGSCLDDVGEAKVSVSAAHAARIAPDAEVMTTQAKITLESTARLVLDADIVFGCTDDNAGRLVLSRIASYLLTPVIDCGVLLSSDPGGRAHRNRRSRDGARPGCRMSGLSRPH